jgi:hypothetical protein
MRFQIPFRKAARDAGDGVSATNGRDWGEAGLVAAAGVRGRRERARRGGGGALICGPGWCGSNQI